MEYEQGEDRIPPAAMTFLERHRPAGSGPARVDRNVGEDRGSDDGGDDNEARDQHDADGDLEVEAPAVTGDHEVAIDANPGLPVPLPPKNIFLASRPRAKGVSHPPVPTRAQIDRHALEQHVNYAPWCPHCLQASALVRKHVAVTGEFPSSPTISADFCFMKGRDADAGDGIPVLVMRDSQTRSLFSHACAGQSTSSEGYSGYSSRSAWRTLIACRRMFT